jgi:hypothetical protein
MDTVIMKSVLAAEALSSVISMAFMASVFWLLSVMKRRLERRRAEQLAGLKPPYTASPGCRHCPACRCWTGGTKGPCMTGEFCDACKPKFHPPAPPATDNATNEEGSTTP